MSMSARWAVASAVVATAGLLAPASAVTPTLKQLSTTSLDTFAQAMTSGAADPVSGTVWAVLGDVDTPWSSAQHLTTLGSTAAARVTASNPGSIGFDAKGRMYVGECMLGTENLHTGNWAMTGSEGIEVFPAAGSKATGRYLHGAKTTLTSTDRSCDLLGNHRVVAAPDGTIYAATGSNVVVFGPKANGNVAPERKLETGSTISALARGVTSGRLYVRSTDGKTRVFAGDASGAATPLRTAPAAALSVSRPFLSADNFGNVYVLGTASLAVYSPQVADGGPATATYAVPTMGYCDGSLVDSLVTISRNRRITITCTPGAYPGRQSTFAAVVARHPVTMSSALASPWLTVGVRADGRGGYLSGVIRVTLTAAGRHDRFVSGTLSGGYEPRTATARLKLPALPKGRWTATIRYGGNADFSPASAPRVIIRR